MLDDIPDANAFEAVPEDIDDLLRTISDHHDDLRNICSDGILEAVLHQRFAKESQHAFAVFIGMRAESFTPASSKDQSFHNSPLTPKD
jgi:hypothetical protein